MRSFSAILLLMLLLGLVCIEATHHKKFTTASSGSEELEGDEGAEEAEVQEDESGGIDLAEIEGKLTVEEFHTIGITRVVVPPTVATPTVTVSISTGNMGTVSIGNIANIATLEKAETETITGTVANVNAQLAQLLYTAPDVAGIVYVHLAVTITDANGAVTTSSHEIAVTGSDSVPSIEVASAVQTAVGEEVKVSGVLIDDDSATNTIIVATDPLVGLVHSDGSSGEPSTSVTFENVALPFPLPDLFFQWLEQDPSKRAAGIFTVTATDSTGHSSSIQINVGTGPSLMATGAEKRSVTAVNKAPASSSNSSPILAGAIVFGVLAAVVLAAVGVAVYRRRTSLQRALESDCPELTAV
eukprot:NODE_375_length_1421_cov_54.083819_g151_i1.p1 GENE.NODE_375_length_1421_cov_54.083819_g151_i1~~NODE_375_length_1421_cov_54.083819_g151_i1.p1  ORF type:complete len:357 (+),score=179.79 NODE_375_length_1421_cov_54.083819_g151_i1:54-1124(+)